MQEPSLRPPDPVARHAVVEAAVYAETDDMNEDNKTATLASVPVGPEGSAIGRALRDVPDEVIRQIADAKDVGHARSRIAALMVDLRQMLASVPAGDEDATSPPPRKVLGEGNALMEARIRFRSNFPQPYNNLRHITFRYNEGTWCADNLLGDLRVAQEANGCLCDFVAVDVLEIDGKALARPRAAVGEREAERIHAELQAEWLATAERDHPGDQVGWGKPAKWLILRAILALQSPPAKVEE